MEVWSWRQAILKSKLEATTKLVLLCLSTYMNDHGEGCYPSQERVAEDTSLTKRAVIVHIKKAIDAGWLKKDKRGLRGYRWDANEYRAAMPKGMNHVHPSSAKTGDEPDSPHAEEGCTTFTPGVNDVHPNSPPNSLSPTTLSGSLPPQDFFGSENAPKKEEHIQIGKRVTHINDLVIDEDIRVFAAARNPGLNLESELEDFKLWRQARDRRFKDYRAAFKNWLKKAKQQGTAYGKSSRGSTIAGFGIKLKEHTGFSPDTMEQI